MERRKQTPSKSSPLPSDYLKLVSEVFAANFDSGLKKLSAHMGSECRFDAGGGIFADELVLCVTLACEGQIAATSVYASMDFDPKASAPTLQDLLAALVDGVGGIFGQLFGNEKKENIEALASESLSVFEGIPFHWSEIKVDRHRMHVKIDKSNPRLDKLADDWLAKNDPHAAEREAEEREETEKLFITGKERPDKGPKGSGTIH